MTSSETGSRFTLADTQQRSHRSGGGDENSGNFVDAVGSKSHIIHAAPASNNDSVHHASSIRSLQLIKNEDRRDELIYELETIPDTAPTDWSNDQLIAVILGAATIVILLLIAYFCCKSLCWYINRGNDRRNRGNRGRGGYENDDDNGSYSGSNSASSESSATIKEREEVAQLGASIIGNVMALNKQFAETNPNQQPTYNYNIQRPVDDLETRAIVDENGYIHQQHALPPQPPGDDDSSGYSDDTSDSHDTLDHVRLQHEH